MAFLKEFLMFLKQNRKLWLLPVLLIMLFVGTLIFFTSGTVIAPFIYTLF